MRSRPGQLHSIRNKREKAKAQKLYRVEAGWFSRPMYCYPADPRFLATTTSV